MNGRGKRSRVALLLLLTFAAGIAGGIMVERLWLTPEAVADTATRDAETGEGEQDSRDGRRRGVGETVIMRFADELGLTDEQRSRIRPIVDDFYASMHELSREVRPRFEAVVDSARAEIYGVLTPEQAERYRELLDERLNRRRDRDRRDWDDRDRPPAEGGDRPPEGGDDS